MALTTGEFHTITILPSSGAAWSLLTSFPTMYPFLVDAQVNSTAFVVYCIDAPTGELAYEGGAVVGLVDSVLNSVSAPLASITVTDAVGNVAEWGEDGSGDVWVFSPASGVLTRCAAAEAAALKAWLP